MHCPARDDAFVSSVTCISMPNWSFYVKGCRNKYRRISKIVEQLLVKAAEFHPVNLGLIPAVTDESVMASGRLSRRICSCTPEVCLHLALWALIMREFITLKCIIHHIMQGPVLPKFGDSSVLIPTSFDVERPIWHANPFGRAVFSVSHAIVLPKDVVPFVIVSWLIWSYWVLIQLYNT